MRFWAGSYFDFRFIRGQVSLVHFVLVLFAFDSFILLNFRGWLVIHGEHIIVRDVIIEWVWGFA